MKKENLNIVEVDITSLKTCEYNPRYITPIAFEQLKESITKFDIVQPLLVNSNTDRLNIIIGGNQRFEALKELGYKKIPVIFLNLNLEKEKELNLRLNINNGDWDFNLLKDYDSDLLLNIGFSDTDLSSVFDDVLELEEDEFDVTKHLEKVKTTDIKTGDVFLLAENIKIICGDSLEIDTYKKIFNEEKIDIFFTDFPYNIKYDYSKGLGKNNKYGGNVDDNKSYNNYKKFVKTIIENSKNYTKKDSHFFSFCDQNYTGLIQEVYRELNISTKRTAIWIKNSANPTPKVAMNKCYEPCVYGTIGKPYLNESIKNLNEIMNKEISSGNRLSDDILDLLDIWLVPRIAGIKYLHPTQKPVTLYEKSLRRCSKINDLIFDACTGSGSLAVACLGLKRKFIGIEKDPIFCQVILDRFEELTGKKAIKLNK